MVADIAGELEVAVAGIELEELATVAANVEVAAFEQGLPVDGLELDVLLVCFLIVGERPLLVAVESWRLSDVRRSFFSKM
jgi:hypothetical protein